MKKMFSIMMTVVILILMFVGCSTNVTNNNESLESIEPVSLVGEYQQVAFGLDLKYKFNDNNTYDELNTDEKGTYSEYNGNGFSLTHNSNRNYVAGLDTNYCYVNGYYCSENNTFGKDEEYGIAISFDENGKTNQAFSSAYYFTDYKDKYYQWVVAFNEDGSIFLRQYNIDYATINGTQMLTPNKELQVVEGTYTVENNIVKISCKDGTSKVLVIENDKIYWDVLEKIN